MDPNSVSIATDLTSGGCAGHIMFVQYFPEVYEPSASMDWAPGKGLLRHAIAAKVNARGSGVVLDGHDLGPMLPHLPSMFALDLLKSSRKTAYSASTVVIEGKPAACADVSRKTWMMLCGDIATPQGENTTNATHGVFVGLSKMDRLRGDVGIVVSMVTDTLAFGLSVAGMIGGKPPGVSDVFADIVGVDPTKAVIGAAVNLAGSVVVSAASSWEEPIVVKLEIGGSYGGHSVECGWSPAKGTVNAKGNVAILGVKGGYQADYNKGDFEGKSTVEEGWGGNKGEWSWGDAL